MMRGRERRTRGEPLADGPAGAAWAWAKGRRGSSERVSFRLLPGASAGRQAQPPPGRSFFFSAPLSCLRATFHRRGPAGAQRRGAAHFAGGSSQARVPCPRVVSHL